MEGGGEGLTVGINWVGLTVGVSTGERVSWATAKKEIPISERETIANPSSNKATRLMENSCEEIRNNTDIIVVVVCVYEARFLEKGYTLFFF